MKNIALMSCCLILLGCSTSYAPPAPKIIGGKGNPATLHCLDKGGKSIAMKDKDGGEYAKCQLPSGELIEEWEFYRQSNS